MGHLSLQAINADVEWSLIWWGIALTSSSCSTCSQNQTSPKMHESSRIRELWNCEVPGKRTHNQRSTSILKILEPFPNSGH